MPKQPETKELNEWIDRMIRRFGDLIWIERQASSLVVGTPDCYACAGVFLPMEAKYTKSVRGEKALQHPFKQIQIHNMEKKKRSGAFPVGLIFRSGENDPRWILPEDVPEDGQLSHAQIDALPVFNLLEIVELGTQHQRRCSERLLSDLRERC